MSTSPLSDWVGRTERLEDLVTATPYAALSAMLDRPADRPPQGTELPPVWHWLYFLPLAQQSTIGADGHPRRGGFLPPVPLPRRMWAGSQMQFHQPIRIGERVSRVTRIETVEEKTGRTGTLVFVKVRHEISVQGALTPGPALVEFHDIVYRDLPRPDDAAPPPKAAPAAPGNGWERKIVPDDVLLFRYSALTFNGHRIHYDRRYVTGVEGYPGLIVHGPLIATLLLDALRHEHPQARVARFEFRAMRPTFDLN
ncbi:MAG: MaoC family dehydratase N-terminal domain-containing protein, partial [Quisquiliibacterium sp.]